MQIGQYIGLLLDIKQWGTIGENTTSIIVLPISFNYAGLCVLVSDVNTKGNEKNAVYGADTNGLNTINVSQTNLTGTLQAPSYFKYAVIGR